MQGKSFFYFVFFFYNLIQFFVLYRDKLHALEYPPGERLIIKPIIDIKPSAESVFPFDGKFS